ncbi:MAG: hypothetical protein QM779_01430 [Propionicimonas sp.]|uniref:hypothetical protein n=1 Tax=Propionicimonas sp. TaxID=1955623 RepID=UPI003D12547D
MTTTDEHTYSGTSADATDALAALPLWPWNDLRASTGMLLGADDFDVLMGNPRAKHQLHNAWLHGRGVVWGLRLREHGEWELEVSRGLAIDGWGRELHLDAGTCLSFRQLLEDDHDPTCGNREVVLCVVASFDACLDAPVPALADPCDVTRDSEEYSRVVERVRLTVVRGCPPAAPPAYHRVRVLLGLDVVGEDDEPGKQALVSLNEVLAAPAASRARELLWHFRCLAALDAADRRPAGGACEPGLFPVAEADAGVVLGCLHLTVRDESGCPDIVEVTLDQCCRETVLPTTVIQDLVCGFAPGLLGEAEAGVGPQAVPGSIEWGPHAREFSFAVTADLLPSTLTRDAISVTSLSTRGWVVEDLERRPRYDKETGRVVVRLADRPIHPLIRVVLQGTGPTPVYGADPPVPLAGVVGDDPGHTAQGRDAVLSGPNPLYEGADSGDHHEE